jgi:hypothetical protein
MQFAAVLQSVDDEGASNVPSLGSTAKSAFTALCSRTWVLAVLTSVASAMLVLCLRPPFALTFHVDRRRPWQARSSICWWAVATVAVAAALLVWLSSFVSDKRAGGTDFPLSFF